MSEKKEKKKPLSDKERRAQTDAIVNARIKAGAPTLYRPEYCQLVIEEMKTGASIVSFAAKIGVHRDTIFHWAKTIPEFSDSLKQAQLISQAWWENLMRATAAGQAKGNLGAQIFWMKNRFRDDWKDRYDHEIMPVAAENEILKTIPSEDLAKLITKVADD